MTLILVYTLSKTILGHSFFNYILVSITTGMTLFKCEIYFVQQSGVISFQKFLSLAPMFPNLLVYVHYANNISSLPKHFQLGAFHRGFHQFIPFCI